MKKILPFLLIFSLFFVACGAKTDNMKDAKDTKAPMNREAPKNSDNSKKDTPKEQVSDITKNLETTFGPMMDEFIKEKNITVPAGSNRMQYISENHNNDWQDFMGKKAKEDPEFMKKMIEMPK